MRKRRSYRRVRGKVSRGRREAGGYHLATLALISVIIFLFAGIATQYNIRTTGYAAAPTTGSSFDVVRSYVTYTYNCQSFRDNYDPYKAGYVVHSGDVVSKDSCIDDSKLLEYSCDALGRLKSDIGICWFGCVKDGAYGYCR